MESRGAMDNDYDYYVARMKAGSLPPPPPPPPPLRIGSTRFHPTIMTHMEPLPEQRTIGTPPRHPTVTPTGTPKSDDDISDQDDEENEVGGDEALLDLAQLEELHQEAERMKALGNKHMAAQVCKQVVNHGRVFQFGRAHHIYASTMVVLFSFSIIGVYQSLQRLLGSPSALSCGPVITRLFVQSIGSAAVAQEIFSGCHRRQTSHRLGSNLWQSTCTSWTVAVLPEGLRRGSCCL